jgi:uncharacterized protein (DUF779 family)
MNADSSPRVVATDPALAELERLREQYGPLLVFQSGGCCDGSSPMCFPAGEFLLGPNDLLLGEVGGCPFYVDAEQYERWRRPVFVLDVATGAGSGLSLEGVHDLHFVVRPPAAGACSTPAGSSVAAAGPSG